MSDAPGHPGIQPRWTSSAKDGVGTALDARSEVWFTLSHGILNEIYYPRVDQACTRDCGLIVTDGVPGGLFVEEKRDMESEVRRAADGVPLHTLVNRCRAGRFTIHKQIVSDPLHSAVLQRISLKPGNGISGLRLFVLLAPHLVNGGADNTGWLGTYKGADMLFASGDGTTLALACDSGFKMRSVGFVGTSDGWQILRRHGYLADIHDRAADGNVALVAEIDADRPVLLAIGFGRKPEEAAFQAASSLARGYDRAEADYATAWRRWQAGLEPLDPLHGATPHNFYRISTAVLRTHESPRFPGGTIASLSIPWGTSKGDDDMGGYHLVWARDLVETAGALLACGAVADARRTLDYLRAVQEPDGHWLQNCWLDGTAYWGGLQMDETAYPILLLDLAFRSGAVPEQELVRFWPMVRAAAGFIVRNGPATEQDRWEENAGYTPATLAVEIAGLLVAAELAQRLGETRIAGFLRDTADAWNADIDAWIHVCGTDLADALGVSGYYLRIAPEGDRDLSRVPRHARVTVRNRPSNETSIPADELVGADALALVRFGLRAANDPRILDTIKVVDHLTRVDLPQGPAWHRYNRDGYGEHDDGRPFDGVGRGRAWPLLTGERAHYAILAGDLGEAARLRSTMEGCASRGGLLPEQVWDADDISWRGLIRGQPSGSAMPLVWAHAEYIKLLRSLRDEAVFDLPPQTVLRYLVEKRGPRLRDWRESWRRTRMPAGQNIRVELCEAAMIHWSVDDWRHTTDTLAEDTGLGLFAAELPTAQVPAGSRVVFTWRRPDGTWRGQDFEIAVQG
ncbi:glycoside hydrolase family 15 protein [Gluconacetobacter tumulisoli]|uniref:Glucan 1,4-alpha-glucosidase n=1 Tax=Gluconacetobacter tumulisoli TaxID=1286189 RepID=A0A7W4K5Q9_9PROT|nr:glycoside hydrolase family 15 protein [Gluconacetobacter tumulisoli]MBB2200884.1 glucan 1,4-alpha-glucosidase [Gluconacetobacter tumulisoli]